MKFQWWPHLRVDDVITSDGKKHGCQKWSNFEGCVRKLIVKQFLDGKHDRKLANIVSTPVATVSKVLKENYCWGCAEMFAGDNNICIRFVMVNWWFKVWVGMLEGPIIEKDTSEVNTCIKGFFCVLLKQM